jgi:hypothetical protein
LAEILVQVTPRYSDDYGDLASRSVGPEVFKNRINEIGESLSDIANVLRAQLETKLRETNVERGWVLDSVELKFSMDLEAEAGVIIGRAKASAGFEVTLGWTTG